ncbi:HEAT repeat domain-containing protein [Streptomyces cacaoi]|uniref:Transcriptional regulator n=1 Tax=Streptomyces cacaoi TaxID=1898 RepID=A0A4Y3QYK1_STRCI|nr:HEAT repeat domain-containing protein [Streptomyces cacaoi]NNG87804.1 MerR family transcriptional regulator [Streptomyces cacaoi]GEB49727.1 transcriptional regulator [Streptomyces cacaoi]
MLIGEVARRSGVSARMLRHYEALGLVRPSGRTGSGYREYSGADIRRIFHVESLRSLGLSLREIRRALDEPGCTPSALVGDLIRQTRERLAAETELLTRLRRIDAVDPAGWEDVLRIVALLQALGSPSPGARQHAALLSASSAGPSSSAAPSASAAPSSSAASSASSASPAPPASPASPADEVPVEVPVPVDALVEAVLNETEPNVAGALRWALARSGDGAPALLAEGLDSPAAAVRERAVRALAELPGPEATAQLRRALAHPDAVVRACAALELGARGAPEAVPTLIDMIVEGTQDTDAADALSVPASDPATAERIVARLLDRLAHGAAAPPVRSRLAQALAAVPGPTATRALVGLTHDEHRTVALTATYLLRERTPD